MPPEQKKTEKLSPDKGEERKSLSSPDLGHEKSQEAKYTVQLASLGERERADKMINELVNNGYPAYYYETNVIRCGKFVNKADADKLAGEIAKDQGIKGFVSRME